MNNFKKNPDNIITCCGNCDVELLSVIQALRTFTYAAVYEVPVHEAVWLHFDRRRERRGKRGAGEGRGQRHLSLLLSAECCEAVNSCIQRVVQKIEMALRRVHRQRQRFSSHCNDLNTLW